jgi:hypothetical protein
MWSPVTRSYVLPPHGRAATPLPAVLTTTTALSLWSSLLNEERERGVKDGCLRYIRRCSSIWFFLCVCVPGRPAAASHGKAPCPGLVSGCLLCGRGDGCLHGTHRVPRPSARAACCQQCPRSDRKTGSETARTTPAPAGRSRRGTEDRPRTKRDAGGCRRGRRPARLAMFVVARSAESTFCVRPA